MNYWPKGISLFLCSLWLGSNPVGAVDFEKDVFPIFEEHCLECHNAKKQKSGFRLDRLSSLLKGGESGEAAVISGNPGDSFLSKVIRHEESGYEMPPEAAPLTKPQISTIEQWILEGAKTPSHYGPAREKIRLTHWSFLPPKRPDFGNSIDDFIRRKLSESNLKASPSADRKTLVRRLYLVMLGLPPQPQDLDQFLDPGDWDQLVEEVLTSPHYGERWAAHWLDLVRFGETHGFEMNRERPTAWPYRDWVIEAFNSDKPYDEFVREQLAGDLLGADPGTGFLVAGPKDQVGGKDPKLRQMQRMNELDDMINTTGTAFLGLTTGCARCHNHKFDPISQRDYYAMQAVFAGVQHGDRARPLSESQRKRLAEFNKSISDLESNLEKYIPAQPSGKRPAVNPRKNEERFSPREARFVRFQIKSKTQACIDELEIFSNGKNVALASHGAKATSSGDFVHPLHKLAHINDGKYGNAKSWIVLSSKGDGWVQIEFPRNIVIDQILWGRDREGKYTDRLALQYSILTSTEPGKWEEVASSKDRTPGKAKPGSGPNYQFAGLSDQEATRGKQLLKALTEARKRKSELERSALVYAGTFQQPGVTHRLYRGEPDLKREAVGPDAIEVFTSLGLDSNAPEKQRRRAFAEWVASSGNPLTARVIVNRIWQFHFGTGMVDTPSDFGKNGTPPSHPELLDWLAIELMDHQWSLKHIHRLILHSQTWQQSNRPRKTALQVDAGTRLLWRFPSRRLEAEGIRDSILSVAGSLDLKNRGGPGFSPFEVTMENVRHYHPKQSYTSEDWRRMIYMTKVRQEKESVFGAFDCPDASQAVPKRSRSTTPLQALNLLNSSFVMQQAELFAKRLLRETSNPAEQVKLTWQLCFSRTPTGTELAEATTFIKSEGLTAFTRAILNANEFVFIP